MRQSVACGEGAGFEGADAPVLLHHGGEEEGIDEGGIGETIFAQAGGVDLHVHDFADELGVRTEIDRL